MATIQEILEAKRIDPSFSFRPNQKSPLPGEMSLDRGSAAWVRDPTTGHVVEKQSGEIPHYGPQGGIAISESSTNLFTYPVEFRNWSKNNIGTESYEHYTVLGKDYDKFREPSSGTVIPKIYRNFSIGTDKRATLSAVVRLKARSHIELQMYDGSDFLKQWFNMTAGTVGSHTEEGGTSRFAAGMEHLQDDFYRLHLAGDPASGTDWIRGYITITDSDGSEGYAADGSVVQAQVEPGGMVSHPIFETGDKFLDDLSVEVPAEDFNDEQGTIVIVFEPKTSRPELTPKISEDIYFSGGTYNSNNNSETDKWDLNFVDTINNKFGPLNVVVPYERNVVLVSWNTFTDRIGAAANGVDNETDYEGVFDGRSRVKRDFHGGGSDTLPYIFHEFRYSPRYMPKKSREAFTARST
jgi:hypothetical protein